MYLALFEGNALSVDDFSSVFSAITDKITVGSVVGVIAAVLAVTVGFSFMWWGARYGIRKIFGAIKRGRS